MGDTERRKVGGALRQKMGGVLAWLVIVGAAAGVSAGFFSDGFGRDAAPVATPAGGPSQQLAVQPVAAAIPAAVPLETAALPDPPTTAPAATEPPNYVPRDVQLYEAHWQGMDTRLLDAELRQKLKYPRGLEGILIGEVTLNAAEAGLLAGDVIIEVQGEKVTTLEQFQQRTRAVRNRRDATITLLRKSGKRQNERYAMRRLTLILKGEPDLGFAQVEGAPMILPGDPRPHPDRGRCTNCHAVGKGFELTPDPDLITLPPPPISRESVVKGLIPHGDRGPCAACHIVGL